MTGALQNKIALIVGGTSGIGRTVALRFAQEGACVVVAGRDGARGAAVERSLREQGGKGLFVPVDVADDGAMRDLVEAAVKEFGGLHVAFNNAGLAGTGNKTAAESEADWLAMINTKLNGVWRGMRHQLPAMLASGGGAIVNMAGNWGLVGFPGYAAYCAAAHGVMGLTKAAALEYAGAGIRVNAVCPGAVDAPILDRMTGGDSGVKGDFARRLPIGRLCSQEDVANAVLWLASEDSAYINGAGLTLDGGGSP